MNKIFINGEERVFDGLVHTTTNYDSFSHLLGNRHIKMEAVEGLKRSMENTGIIPMPIIVNERNEIIDGQHRAAAISLLGGTVYYIIVPGLTLQDCVTINCEQHSWKTMDFVYTYAEQHYPQYEALVGFIEKNPDIEPEVVLRAMFDSHGGAKFRNGEGKLIDAALGLSYLKAIRAWNAFGKYRAKTAFVDALKIMTAQGADMNNMISSIQKFGIKYKETCLGSAEPAYALLTDIYNFKKSSNKVDFRPYGAQHGRKNGR